MFKFEMLLTVFTVSSSKECGTGAEVGINQVNTGAAIITRIRVTVIGVCKIKTTYILPVHHHMDRGRSH